MPSFCPLKTWSFWLPNPTSVFVLPVRQLTHTPHPPGRHNGYPIAPAETSPLPRSGKPIMPIMPHLELIKLSLWQSRDSKP